MDLLTYLFTSGYHFYMRVDIGQGHHMLLWEMSPPSGWVFIFAQPLLQHTIVAAIPQRFSFSSQSLQANTEMLIH